MPLRARHKYLGSGTRKEGTRKEGMFQERCQVLRQEGRQDLR